MKAWMEPEGTLYLEASDGVEYYALTKWVEDFNESKTTLMLASFNPGKEDIALTKKKVPKIDPH